MMAMTKKGDIKSMGIKELKDKIAELRKELIKENAQVARGTSLKSPGQMRLYKRSIARMLTLINEKSSTTSIKKEQKKAKPKKEVQDG